MDFSSVKLYESRAVGEAGPMQARSGKRKRKELKKDTRIFPTFDEVIKNMGLQN